MTEQTAQTTTTKPQPSSKSGPELAAIDREELRRLYEESCARIIEGSVVKGKIVRITTDEVYVDIGYKSEGVVPLSEFSDRAEIKPGDEIDVLLESKEDPDGMVVLSRIKAEKERRWDETILRSNEGDIVQGKIMRKVRGGVIVDIGMDAFLPASQMDVRHVGNPDDYVGRSFDFKIIKINTERKNIVLSRRELLEEERARNRERLLSEIEVGETREGIVKNITDFGAFIDLYGMDGLLHITDMTWSRINHPSEMVSIGDKIQVVILDFDREKQRIALGLKQKAANPWQDIETKHPVGSIVKGRIVNILPYGAFIEIEKGVEGLIHISEMSWTKRINHPSEILSVGDEVEAMVLSIKKDEAKISLGIKQTEFNPWSAVEEKYPPGTRVRGKVRNITSYGAFVELEPGIDGLIHISDMSWTRKINHPSEVLKKGEMTEAVVLAVDQEAKKITLGLKQLEANPWETLDQFVRVGSVVEAEVTKIADFGVFAVLEIGIECLIHVSQLSEKPFQKIDDVVKKGDRIRAKVDRIDKQRRKIALSMREYQRETRLAEERAAMEAAKAVSLGEESIIDMREHLEEAVEKIAAPREPEQPPPAEEMAQPLPTEEVVEAPPAAIEHEPIEKPAPPPPELPVEQEKPKVAEPSPEQLGSQPDASGAGAAQPPPPPALVPDQAQPQVEGENAEPPPKDVPGVEEQQSGS
jgi:small subunit ribosomal protein S1